VPSKSPAHQTIAARMLAELRAQRGPEDPGALLDWVPRLTPHYMRPTHLEPLTQRIERALRGERIRVVVHAPPRCAKTETVLHSVSYGLKLDPRTRFGYASYNADIALSKSRDARSIAQRSGVTLARNTLRDWRNSQGGGLLATGIGGGLTGYGLNIAFVDDPLKDRVEAESALRRQRIHDWFREVLTTRMQPGGSIFVFATRWHPDDLSGRLIKQGWEYICLPALRTDEAGNELSLWPEFWTADAFKLTRAEIGAYSWESLYQGQPRPRGGSVFGEVTGYLQLPRLFRPAIGIDLAYAAKSSSDWSCIVVMFEAIGADGRRTGEYFVKDVLRVQARAPQFLEMCKLYRQQYPTAPWRWYASGTEAGAADFMLGHIPLQVMPPRGDKFTRSIPYAAAWNARKVRVPGGSEWKQGKGLEPEAADPPPSWVNPFVSEHADFTGVNDAHDDQVDAGVAAYDLLAGGGSSEYGDDVVGGQSRRTF